MTDLRSTTDDRFERELRATLLAATSPHAPRSLERAALAIVARPAPVRSSSWRVPTGLLAAALGLAVLGLGLGSLLPPHRTAVAPAGSQSPIASTAPTSPGPTGSAEPAYVWRVDQVRLTAADVELTIGEKRWRAEPKAGRHGSILGDEPSSWTLPFILRSGERTWLLYLDLRSDGTDWWVQQARLPKGKGNEVILGGPFLRTPIGEAFHGDIALGGADAGVPVAVTIRDATLDPVGFGTGPHDWDDCTLFGSLDAATKASVRDAERPEGFVRLADEMDLCVVYLWRFLSTDGYYLLEVWCTPPTSGTFARIRVGQSGEAVVEVIDPSQKEAPRQQPREGWGCQPEAGAAPSGMSSPTPANAS